MKCAVIHEQPCHGWLVGLDVYPLEVFLMSFDLWAELNSDKGEEGDEGSEW